MIMDEVTAKLGQRCPDSVATSGLAPKRIVEGPTRRTSPLLGQSTRKQDCVTVAELWERWCAYNGDKLAASTIHRYSPSLKSAAAYFGSRDIRAITGDDIYGWAELRRAQDGIQPLNPIQLFRIGSLERTECLTRTRIALVPWPKSP